MTIQQDLTLAASRRGERRDPSAMSTCTTFEAKAGGLHHPAATAEFGGYVAEGHVPAGAIGRLLAELSQARGIRGRGHVAWLTRHGGPRAGATSL